MNTYEFKRGFRRELTELVMFAVLRDSVSLGSALADCLERVDKICDDFDSVYDSLSSKCDDSSF